MKYVKISWIERKSRNGGDVFAEHSVIGQLLEKPEPGNFLRVKDRYGVVKMLGKILRINTYVIPIWRHDPKKIDNIKNIEKIISSVKKINAIMGRPKLCLVKD